MTLLNKVTRAKRLAKIALRPQNIFCDTKHIFLFSHMRSRSSVLSHILGSNQEICGYRELHISYRDRFALYEMRALLAEELNCELEGKFLFDKALHNKHHFSDDVFAAASPKVIFLLRSAESTLRSIINMGELTGDAGYKNPKMAVYYYCSRLEELTSYAKRLNGNYFYIDSDSLVDEPEPLLQNLSTWLGLKQPLAKSYSTFDHTGKAGHGDPSVNIKSGVLKKTKGHPNVKIPQDLLKQAEDAYHRCRSAITDDPLPVKATQSFKPQLAASVG